MYDRSQRISSDNGLNGEIVFAADFPLHSFYKITHTIAAFKTENLSRMEFDIKR